jgi:hypothetical protein
VNPRTLDAKLIRRVDDSFSWAPQPRPPQNPDICKDR